MVCSQSHRLTAQLDGAMKKKDKQLKTFFEDNKKRIGLGLNPADKLQFIARMKELVPLKISQAAEFLRPTATAYKTAIRFARNTYDNLNVVEKQEQEWRYYNVCYLLHLGAETGQRRIAYLQIQKPRILASRLRTPA